MRTPKIQIAYGEDWEGLYIDGELVCEDHTLSYQDVLEALNIKFSYLTVDQEFLEERGTLPKNIEDVIEEKYE